MSDGLETVLHKTRKEAQTRMKSMGEREVTACLNNHPGRTSARSRDGEDAMH